MPSSHRKKARSPKRRSASAKDTLKMAQAIFAADRKAKKDFSHRATRQEAFDYFTNAMARTGFGTASIPEATEYNLERLSNDYFLMLTLYRNHWIARRIVDVPSTDMTRAWPKMQCDRSPQDLEKFKQRITRSYTPSAIRTAIKWARLYGGAGGLITIRGHEDILDEPLDLDDVTPNSFLGVTPFDRWVGIYPEGMVRDDYGHPSDWGMPEYYTVRGPDTSESFRIHASRILRFCGPSVPTPELQAQIYWGISVLEIVWEELKKRDNASFAILNLLFRANLIAQVNPELAQMLSGLGSNQTALKNFWARMQAQNEILSNQSMLILGKDADMKQIQYSFSGMDGLYGMFQMDVAGAAEIPVTRLFGRTVTGLGQSNDADERYYEEMIASRQHEELQPQLDKLYPVVAMSTFGEVPDDMDITFPSVRVLTEEEKADLVEKTSAPVLAAYNAGLISQRSALKDLRQIGDLAGTVFTNITDEDIEKAETEPVMPGGEELPEGFEENPPEEKEEKGKKPEAGEEEEPEAKKGPVEQAANRVGSMNPQRLLRRASGGAEDSLNLSSEQERVLLAKHLTGEFPGQKWSTVQWLLKHGYFAEEGKNIKVTAKGKEYCDRHHLKMPFGSKDGGAGAEDALSDFERGQLEKELTLWKRERDASKRPSQRDKAERKIKQLEKQLNQQGVEDSSGHEPVTQWAEDAKEIVLYGLPRGATERYEEVLLLTNATPEKIKKAKELATKDGFHSFRTAVIDLDKPPDFKKTVKTSKNSARDVENRVSDAKTAQNSREQLEKLVVETLRGRKSSSSARSL